MEGLTRCDNCFKPGRPAKLIMQEVVGPCYFGKVPPFVFRYRLCQWCLAAENRRAAKAGRPKRVTLAYKPDAEVWAEHNAEVHGRAVARTAQPLVGSLDGDK